VLLEPGQIFASRYRVLRCIAEGGMGAIFEAEHVTTERRVALKLLYPHIISQASIRRKFELEARISARVNSRHIVAVLDAGFDEASRSPYLVMELLEGQTLGEHIDERGPLAPREALRVLQQVAAGLDAAHAYRDPDGTPKPILHRDLKPDNLFLVQTHPGAINVKILDYGIAKMLGGTTHLSDQVQGTPQFMAFEQITAGALSAQTDIWAFGLVAFYALTGMPYWRSAADEVGGLQVLFAEILTLPLELPSVRLRQEGSGIELPAGFDAWLLRCIQREPSQRFATATAAVEALAGVFDIALENGGRSPARRLASAEQRQQEEPAIAEAPSAPWLLATPRRPARPRVRVPPSFVVRRVASGAFAGAILIAVTAWLGIDDDPPAASASSAAEPRASAPSPIGAAASPWYDSSAPDAPADARDGGAMPAPEGATPAPDDAASDAPSRSRAGASTSKPVQPKRRARPGSSAAYRVR